MLILPRVTNAQPNSLVKVDLPTLAGVITLEGSAGSLFVNDLPATPPTVITGADKVQLGLTTSASLSSTVYCSVYVDAIKTFVGSATTEDTVSRKNYPIYENVGPLDIKTYEDGYPYYKTNFGAGLQDGLTEIDTSFQITDRILDTKPVDGTIPEEDYVLYFDTIWWVNHYGDKLVRANLPNKSMLPPVILPAGSFPYAIGHDSLYNYVVSCTGSNKVSVWETFENGAEPLFSVDSFAPKGVCVYNNKAFVAESGSNTILRIDIDRRTFDRVTVGHGPVEVTFDTTGVYVTCLDDTLWKIDFTGTNASHVAVGKDPVGLVHNAALIYVACSFDNTVEVYNRQLVKQATIQTHNSPQYLAIGNNQLAVCCHGDSRVEFYDLATHSKLGFTKTRDWGFGAFFHNDHWYVFNGNSGTPNRTYVIDSSSDRFGFKPLYDLDRSVSVTSNEIVVDGLEDNLSLPCSIAPIADAVLHINSIPVSGEVLVKNGDRISVSVTTSSEYNTQITIPVTLGQYSVDLPVLTLTFDDTPNTIRFEPVQVESSGLTVFSAEKTVDGLTRAFTTVCHIDSGVLYVNGVPAVNNTAVVKNGDKIKIQQVSGGLTVYTKFTIGDYETTWLLYTASAATHFVSFDAPPVKYNAEPNEYLVTADGFLHTTPVYKWLFGSLVIIGYESVQLTPIEGFDVYVDGVLVPYLIDPDPAQTGEEGERVNSVTVSEGARISFGINTTNGPYDFNFGYAIIDGQLVYGETRNKPDLTPYPILLEDLYETLPRLPYETDPFYIEGVSGPDADVPLSVDWGVLYVNDEERGSSTVARLHDKVVWKVVSEGPYGGVLKYKLKCGDADIVWRLYNKELEGAYLNHGDYLAGYAELTCMQSRPVAQTLIPLYDFERRIGQSTNLSASPDSHLCARPEERKLMPRDGAWSITQVNNLCVVPKALANGGADPITYSREFEQSDQRQAFSYDREFEQLVYSVPRESQESEFLTSPNQEFQFFNNGFVTYGYGVVNLDVRAFVANPIGEIQFARWPFEKNEYVVGIAYEPEFVQERPTLALELIPREAVIYGWGVINLPEPPEPYVHSVEETRLIEAIFDPAFAHYEMFATQASVETAVVMPSVQMFAGVEVAVLMPQIDRQAVADVVVYRSIDVAGFQAHTPINVQVDRSAVFNNERHHPTDFPEYDGKFSTPELAAKQAAINGYKDAEIFLDPDNRYIYRGVCALRTAYNVMGWIRGG